MSSTAWKAASQRRITPMLRRAAHAHPRSSSRETSGCFCSISGAGGLPRQRPLDRSWPGRGVLGRWIEANLRSARCARSFPSSSRPPTPGPSSRASRSSTAGRPTSKGFPRKCRSSTEGASSLGGPARAAELYPFTSHNILNFSRCTGICRTSGDIPGISPEPDGRYRVLRDHLRSNLGIGSAEEAVAIVIAHLPPNCGPAVSGTADDLPNLKA